MDSKVTMDKLVNLCKGRGFVYAGSEIYGGLANAWDYGPLGVELKNNIKSREGDVVADRLRTAEEHTLGFGSRSVIGEAFLNNSSLVIG